MGRKVLVVDDNAGIRQSLIELLEDQGYETAGASNGAEALALLRPDDEPPCLILLDVMMPVMDGIEFRRRQLQEPRTAAIPVVVLSAHRDPAEVKDELHPAEFLRKPIRFADLLGALQRFCPEPAA